MDKQRQMRFSDAELAIIKNTFADNEPLLKALRKVFLQMNLSSSEERMIEGISKNKDVQRVIKKVFLPSLDGDAPINQIVDLWLTLDIKGKDVDVVYHDALARQKLIQYLDEQLSRLKTKRLDGIKFESLIDVEGKDPLSVYINLIVRNTILGHTEAQLQQLSVLAGLKAETVEETKERLLKNSAK